MRNQSKNNRARRQVGRNHNNNNNKHNNKGMVHINIPNQLAAAVKDLDTNRHPKLRLRFLFGQWYGVGRALVVKHPEGDVTISTCVLPRQQGQSRGYRSGGVTVALNPGHLEEGDTFGVISIFKTPAGVWFVDNTLEEVDDRLTDLKGSRYKNWFPPIRRCPNSKWLEELSEFTGLEFRVNEQLLYLDYQSMPLGDFHQMMAVIDEEARAAVRELAPEEALDLGNVQTFTEVLAGAEEPIAGAVLVPPRPLTDLVSEPAPAKAEEVLEPSLS